MPAEESGIEKTQNLNALDSDNIEYERDSPVSTHIKSPYHSDEEFLCSSTTCSTFYNRIRIPIVMSIPYPLEFLNF